MKDNKYSYQITTVSVYDRSLAGSMIEYDFSKGNKIDCSIADLNNDNEVDMNDMVLFNTSFSSARGEANYSKLSDFDRNLQIDANDQKVMQRCMGIL